ncbi:hypothetical protein [Luteimonas sp. 100069]|uniref:hypothetical protein n=1 Tax=Luteimonas sp. 100069 TaxID=2006109 RepID=UPI000F4F56F4|nr:hypothetical protein [Luteimonas sp. 100069]RPD87674.1 hypothetical protein EGK76_00220 [Luteimonas sp. 100069]
MSLTSLLNSFNDSMKGVSKTLRQTNEVNRVTSDLKHHAYAERCVLEAALKLAKVDVETQERRKDPGFRDIHDRFLKAARAKSSSEPKAEPISNPVPNFALVSSHDDPETLAQIDQTVEKIRQERQAFLSKVRAELIANKDALPHFLNRIKEQHSERYLPDLAPPLS